MNLNLCLFGERDSLSGWFSFLEKEKFPYSYCGKDFSFCSRFNLLSSPHIISQKKIKKYLQKEVVFIYNSPNHKASLPNIINHNRKTDSKSEKEEYLSYKETLKRALRLQKIPYVHIWYYNYPSESIFLLRQDVDFVHQEGLKALTSLAKKYKIRGTYFVNISGEEEYEDIIGEQTLRSPTTPKRKDILIKLQKEGNEIGNHGYWHQIFPDYQRNFDNINLANEYLESIFGKIPKGFASPGGEWNSNLMRVLENNNLLYSSNGLRLEGLPYYPTVGRNSSKILEIPFNFFCDASFEKLSLNNIKLIKEDFLQRVDIAIDDKFPITILGHPHLSFKYTNYLYSDLFRKIIKNKIPSITMFSFAKFWKKREHIKISYKQIDKKSFKIKTNSPLTLIRVEIKNNSTFLSTDKRGIIEFTTK